MSPLVILFTIIEIYKPSSRHPASFAVASLMSFGWWNPIQLEKFPSVLSDPKKDKRIYLHIL